MSTYFKNIDLSSHFLGHFHMLDTAFIQNFNGDFLAGDDMMGH